MLETIFHYLKDFLGVCTLPCLQELMAPVSPSTSPTDDDSELTCVWKSF